MSQYRSGLRPDLQHIPAQAAHPIDRSTALPQRNGYINAPRLQGDMRPRVDAAGGLVMYQLERFFIR